MMKKIEIKMKIKTEITGNVIHLLGYYPNPTTERPTRPQYKPVYTYPKLTNTHQYHQHNDHHDSPSRPTWDHETNHISSPSFHPLVHPDEHFGLIDENGFGAEADAVFSHNTYGVDYNNNKPTTFNGNNNDDYRPFQGI